ncbi:Glucose-induced degradation protein 8-like protein [Drosera capensis]
MESDPRKYEHIVVKETDTHNIVLAYLVHNCFKETVESFIASTGMEQPASCIKDMDRRKGIINLVLDGYSLEAIEWTEQLAPDLFQKNKDLHFDLLGLHYVKLVCHRKTDEAVEFAQKVLTPFGMMESFLEKLEDFMALLAYEEPEKSPMFHLVGLDYRQQIADNLNQAILAHASLPSRSSLERLIQQTLVVGQVLNQEQSKDGHPLLSLKDFIKI